MVHLVHLKRYPCEIFETRLEECNNVVSRHAQGHAPILDHSRILLKRSRAEVLFTTRAITVVITVAACLVLRGSFCPGLSPSTRARFSGLTAPSSNRSSSCVERSSLPPSLVLSTHLHVCWKLHSTDPCLLARCDLAAVPTSSLRT